MPKQKRTIYLVVKLVIESEQPITDELKQNFVDELEYNFISPLKDVDIVDTETPDAYDQHPGERY
jgi:hypothetical protein